MASLIGPERFKRSRRLRHMPDTPINRAARPPEKPKDEPEFGPPVDPRRLDEGMQRNREAIYAWAMGGRAERRFVAFLAANRCPMDDWVIVVELVRAWAEGLFLAVAADPRSRHVPCLPGCLGCESNGGECVNLRKFGHSRCPSCESEEDDRAEIWVPRTESEARAAGLSIVRR